MIEMIFLALVGFGIGSTEPNFAAMVRAPAAAAVAPSDVGANETGAARAPEDQTPTGKFLTAGEVRPILDATRGSWIAVRDYNGQDLLYFTHLLAWRCGLWEIRYGLNGAAPDQLFEAEPCYVDTAAPAAIKADTHLPYVTLPPGSVETVTVQLLYDDGGTDEVTFERKAILLP
ncbi:MAG: hypothetical protein GKR99_14010 [Rhodobacteraceae bacterium]|nr:hypothetical protein [Paracoccaceae bacterium]